MITKVSDENIKYSSVAHYINRRNWLRAAVLGANDGILSIASLSIGVVVASNTRESVILAVIAGLIAGTLSMATGEYISVSSQSDIEKSDLKREQEELAKNPKHELLELAGIYERRGLDKETALKVAQQLTDYNALEAHARDELGINTITQAKPLQAALVSGIAFIAGGLFPFLVCLFSPLKYMIYYQYSFTILSLIILGIISAKIGGASIWKSIIRITFLGTIAMVLTALVGHFLGVNVA